MAIAFSLTTEDTEDTEDTEFMFFWRLVPFNFQRLSCEIAGQSLFL